MSKKQRKPIITLLTAIIMVLMMVFPLTVYAEGEVPDESEPSGDSATPVESSAPEVTTSSSESDGDGGSDVSEENEASTEEQTTIAVPSPEEVETGASAEDGLPVEEQAEADAPEDIEPNDLSAVVAAINEADVVIVNQEGEPIPLTSESVAAIMENPDPWYEYNGVIYRFFNTPAPGDPDPCLSFPAGTCFTDTNPIQIALNDAETRVAATGESDRVTICVEAGDYDGDLLIETPVWLQANPGAIITGIIDIQSNWVTVDGFTINGSIQSRLSPTSDDDPYGYQNIRISNNIIYPDTSETSRSDTPAGEQEGGGIGIYIGTRSETFNQTSSTQNYYIANRGALGTTPLDYDPIAPANTFLAGKGLLDFSNLIISGNTIQGGRSAILLQGITGTGSAPIQVIGNTINGITDRSMLWIDSAQFIDVTQNTLTDSPTGTGIYFSSLADGYYTAASSNTPYTPKNINITCNTITNNLKGFYIGDAFEDKDTSSDSLVITLNNISSNSIGMEVYYRYSGYIDAANNYWGGSTPTPAGGNNVVRFYVPGTNYSAATYVQNTASSLYVGGGNGRVYYGPVLLTSPCTDGTCAEFEPLESCVLCDDFDPTVPPAGTTDKGRLPAPAETFPGAPGGLIPVTGGEMVTLSCDILNTLRLPNGDMVVFNQILCDYQASLTDELEETLPQELPEGASFASGMTLVVLKDGVALKRLDVGTLTVYFVIPEGMESTDFGILHWDAEEEEWVELTPVEGADGMVNATTNLTGTFVLVTK